MVNKEMLIFVEKAYNEGNMSVWEYEKYKEEYKEALRKKTAKEMFKKIGYSGWVGKFSHFSNAKGIVIDIDLEHHKVDKTKVTPNTERVCKEYTFDEIKAINKCIEEMEKGDGINGN